MRATSARFCEALDSSTTNIGKKQINYTNNNLHAFTKMKVMKMRASSVISVSLGRFGAVQSFPRDKPVAYSIPHLVHNANPALVYCKRDVVSRNNWMGCTCAPERSNAFGVINDRSPFARCTMSKNALPSSDDSSSSGPITSIWVQLYIDNVESGRTTQVKVERGANVDDLMELVEKEYSEKLVGITAADLMVYAWSDEQFASPLRSSIKLDRSLYGGDSDDRPIRVMAMTPNQVVLPSDVMKWGRAKRKSTDFRDFKKAAKDVFYNFVNPTTKNIIGAGGTWEQDPDLENFAVSLVGHHRAMEKLLDRLDGSSTGENVEEDEPKADVDGCTARHLGAGVIALDLPNNPIEDEEDDNNSILPTVLSRSNIRSIVKQTIDMLRLGKSVLVVGQPGIGKTRSCLLGCLALLLSEGAPVLYLSKKTSTAYLFIPNQDTGRYLAWINEDFVTSRLTGDIRMIVLMDPPEEAGYKWQFRARLVKVCSNNQEKHFQNADKLTQVRFLYSPMPKLKEVFAMAKVLWKDPLSHFPGKKCKDESEMWNILSMRSFLVGGAPRYIFDHAKYEARLQAIRISATKLNWEQSKSALFTSANRVDVIEELFDLDGEDIAGEQARPRVILNGYARYCLLHQLTSERILPHAFVLVNITLLADQCKDGVFNASLSQLPSVMVKELVPAVHRATTDTSIYEALSAALNKTKIVVQE